MPALHNPLTMEPEEIVAEIDEHRETIDRASRRIYELSRVLRDRMRRADPTLMGIYVTYSNAWTRFAGMIQQGLQRTQIAERVLRMLPEETPRAEQRSERPEEEAHPEATPVDQARPVPDDHPLRDFIELYGEEVARDADGPRRT